MEAVLYGYPGSGSAAVEAALSIAGVSFRLVEAASWDEASALDELRRVNPLGQVPTLVFPEGTVMSESAAILAELGLRHPASGLLPETPRERAQSLRGLVYIAANCYACIGLIDYPERFCTPCSASEREHIVAGTRARLHGVWERFADEFDDRPFLAGTHPGALDLLAAVVSKWSGARAHLHQHRPAFFELMQRVEQHPSVKAVFDRHWPAQA